MAKSKNIQASKQPTPQPQPSHQQSQQTLVAAQWSGPLPSPGALEHFDRIIPDGANRIMSMVEREQAHRIAYENTALESTRTDFKRGHIIGAIACFAAIGGAVYTAYIGSHPTVPIAFLSLPVVGMIRAFMPERKQTQQ